MPLELKFWTLKLHPVHPASRIALDSAPAAHPPAPEAGRRRLVGVRVVAEPDIPVRASCHLPKASPTGAPGDWGRNGVRLRSSAGRPAGAPGSKTLRTEEAVAGSPSSVPSTGARGRGGPGPRVGPKAKGSTDRKVSGGRARPEGEEATRPHNLRVPKREEGGSPARREAGLGEG